MAKAHKYANAHIRIESTKLSPEDLVGLAREVSDAFKDIKVVGDVEGGIELVVKSIARLDIGQFVFVASSSDGRTEARTELISYLVQKFWLFPNEMTCYRSYKKYMELLAKTVEADDPAAQVSITEIG